LTGSRASACSCASVRRFRPWACPGYVKVRIAGSTPPAVFLPGVIVEPRFHRSRSRRRRVPDPGRQCRDTLRPPVERGPERPRHSLELVVRVLLRVPAVRLVPDAGQMDDSDPEIATACRDSTPRSQCVCTSTPPCPRRTTFSEALGSFRAATRAVRQSAQNVRCLAGSGPHVLAAVEPVNEVTG